MVAYVAIWLTRAAKGGQGSQFAIMSSSAMRRRRIPKYVRRHRVLGFGVSPDGHIADKAFATNYFVG